MTQPPGGVSGFEASEETPVDPAPGTTSWAAPSVHLPDVSPSPIPSRPRGRFIGVRETLRGFTPRSLTGRLVLGVVGLLIIVVALTSAVTYYAFKPFLNNQLDQQVVSASDPSSLNNYLRAITSTPGMASGIGASQAVWIGIYSVDSQTFDGPDVDTTKLHPLKLTAGSKSGVLSTQGSLHTVVTTDGSRLRVRCLTGNFQLVDGTAVSVVIGLSTDEVDRTLHRLVLLEALIGLSAIIFAAGLTAAGVQYGLRPLKRVSRTAQEVTAELDPAGGGLDRRVPGDDAPTEVQQVASSMNTLLAAMETEFQARIRSEQLMRQFLADASHELRTPLTSIRGYAELSRLQGRTDDPDDPMHRIEIEGTRMSRLVEDLLVLARGEQDVVAKREPVDIDGALTDALNTVSGAHPDRPMSLQADAGVAVLGDRDQLVRLFVNLLNNACVHTAPGGPIRVDASLLSAPDGREAVLVRVLDSGPGLPPEEAAHVFERFWRADKARSRAKGGSGLGMSIVAQIVAAHGGQIRFDSAVETGTTVSVTLPVV